MSHISVIIPTQNRPELFRRALTSALAQTFADIEIIVVDDSAKKLAESVVLEVGDPRVRYIAHGVSRGSAASRNTGIRASGGEMIAFLDDDDEWLSTKLEVQYASLAPTPSDVGLCVTNTPFDHPQKDESKLLENAHVIALQNFRGFPISTFLIKSEVFNDVGYFDESLPTHQEVDLAIRITEKYGIVALSDASVRFGGNDDDKSTKKERLEKRVRGREIVLMKHEDKYVTDQSSLGRHYFTLGVWCRDLGNLEKSQKYLFRAIQLSGHPRYLLHGALVWMKSKINYWTRPNT